MFVRYIFFPNPFLLLISFIRCTNLRSLSTKTSRLADTPSTQVWRHIENYIDLAIASPNWCNLSLSVMIGCLVGLSRIQKKRWLFTFIPTTTVSRSSLEKIVKYKFIWLECKILAIFGLRLINKRVLNDPRCLINVYTLSVFKTFNFLNSVIITRKYKKSIWEYNKVQIVWYIIPR